MGSMDGRGVLVVGASAGIGQQIATRLVALGGNVVFAGRRAGRLKQAIEAAGGGTPVAADVSDPAACADLVDAAAKELGQIDLLVHAASASKLHLLADATAEDWYYVLHTNVVGPALVARAAVPHIPEGGVVAFLSSESVGRPYQGLVPYGASKAALEELVRGFRIEHPELRFANVVVGTTDGTEFVRDFDPQLSMELFPKWIAAGKLPVRRMQAAELGGLIADTLASVVAVPGVDCQELVFRAPGGMYTGDAAFMMEALAAQAEAGTAP